MISPTTSWVQHGAQPSTSRTIRIHNALPAGHVRSETPPYLRQAIPNPVRYNLNWRAVAVSPERLAIFRPAAPPGREFARVEVDVQSMVIITGSLAQEITWSPPGLQQHRLRVFPPRALGFTRLPSSSAARVPLSGATPAHPARETAVPAGSNSIIIRKPSPLFLPATNSISFTTMG